MRNDYYDDDTYFDPDNGELQDPNMVADSFEIYVGKVNSFLVNNRIKQKKFRKSINVMRKAIKNLRNGKYQKVYSPTTLERIQFRDFD